jgi:leucyl aminopeptidase
MTVLKKSPSLKGKENLVVLATKKTNFTKHGLSPAEANFVLSQAEVNPHKAVLINQINRMIFVQLVIEKKDKHTVNEYCRKAGAAITAQCNELQLISVTVVDATGNPSAALALAEGMALANYQFLKYRKEKAKETHSLLEILLNVPKLNPKDIDHLQILVDAVYRTRTLVNEPVSYLNAVQLSKEFEVMGKEAGFRVEVLNKSKIEALKMGGLLSVNLGSVDPPTFTIMEYKPRNAKNKKPIVLVGKGVVYDTGGLSLKPTANSMDMMKCDMAGSAAVAGAIYAAAKAKLPVHIIALAPATDNRPGGNAYVPGDVITMMSGLTVEMLNADAEGRMILADALHYAKRYEPELVLEFSTLTGAAKAAIGGFGIVCMGNASDGVKNKLKESGNVVYERLAEFPFWEEYDELIKSDLAEIKNIGGPEGGSITAGKFLARFTDYPFIHFDIAGPAFLMSRDSWRGKGGTGVGVRLLFDFLKRR